MPNEGPAERWAANGVAESEAGDGAGPEETL